MANRKNTLNEAAERFKNSEFEEALRLFHKGLRNSKSASSARLGYAKCLFTTGRFRESIAQLKRIRDPKLEAAKNSQLVLCYYHLNEFANVANLFDTATISKNPFLQQMSLFKRKIPYQISAGKRSTTIRLEQVDPLPALTLSVNEKELYVVIDTGGWQLILDDKFVSSLEIPLSNPQEGTFGGGKKGQIYFSAVNSVRCGDFQISNVPVSVMNVRRFSPGFKKQIQGIIGTNFLEQFVATIDYPSSLLILGKRKVTKPKRGKKVRFFLHGMHQMYSCGRLNGIGPMLFFVDSGLASEAAFTAPRQTLEEVGVQIPKRRVESNAVGGGGGKWASGYWEIKSLSLGPLTQTNLIGEYGAMTPESKWDSGFRVDGLISHQFLKKYKWTIDFESMNFYFE